MNRGRGQAGRCGASGAERQGASGAERQGARGAERQGARGAWRRGDSGRVLAVGLAALALAGVLAGLLARDYFFQSSARRISAVSFPGGQVEVDVAVTDREKHTGLAGRRDLPPDAGLLFVYRDFAPRRFTMEGMLLNLDLITLSADGTVTGVETRMAGEGAFGTAPARYVLEVGRGWAAAHGVSEGTRGRLLRRGAGVGGP